MVWLALVRKTSYPVMFFTCLVTILSWINQHQPTINIRNRNKRSHTTWGSSGKEENWQPPPKLFWLQWSYCNWYSNSFIAVSQLIIARMSGKGELVKVMRAINNSRCLIGEMLIKIWSISTPPPPPPPAWSENAKNTRKEMISLNNQNQGNSTNRIATQTKYFKTH